MDFDSIFTAYWTQYRADSNIPASTDTEYTVGLRLANEAINHWATYDNTFWKELYTTLQTTEGGSISTGVTQYACPSDFKQAGGHVKVLDSNGKTQQLYPIIEPQDVQFKGSNETYAYFTGDPNTGYFLNINPSPTSTLNGLDIDYVYYKAPTLFTTGTDITEMSDPYFIVHRMLASRFRSSRNPYYEDALRDSENALGKMKMVNESGNWANPWSLADRSGTAFGV